MAQESWIWGPGISGVGGELCGGPSPRADRGGLAAVAELREPSASARDGVCIFFLDAVGPKDRPWMWASGHNGEIRRAAHGYEPTREAAMAAFAKSWRGS